jgi:hypothetical protein
VPVVYLHAALLLGAIPPMRATLNSLLGFHRVWVLLVHKLFVFQGKGF